MTGRWRTWPAWLIAWTLLAQVAPASGQNTHLLLIAGLGGEARYTEAFHGWLSRLADAAVERHGIPANRITYLGEDVTLDPTRIRARSTAQNIQAAFAALGRAMQPADELVVVLAGHGTFSDGTARFNMPGPDMTPEDMGDLLDGLGPRRVTFVNTASASGPFVPALAGQNRTVIAATRTGRERNLTRFGLYFVDAFATEGADVNKDERISVSEAFAYAVREVEREYEGDNLLLTEHAVLDDNGDGEGSRTLGAETGDGQLAATVFLTSVDGGDAAPVSDALRALYADKVAIEARIRELRQIKAQLSQERYEDELEALLVELALKNREIRAASSGG